LAHVRDDERDEAVDEHLKALDAELARLKNMEAAMDRRIADAEEEKRRLEEGPGAGER
jgi:transposase